MTKAIGTILVAVAAAHGADIAIDFGTETGPVNPVHATGQGPLLKSQAPVDLDHVRAQGHAEIPHARLDRLHVERQGGHVASRRLLR